MEAGSTAATTTRRDQASDQVDGNQSVLRRAPRGARSAPLALFVSDRITPRRRMASDFFRLVLGFVVFVALGWLSSTNPTVDQQILALFSDLPGWISTLAWFGFSVGSLVTFGVVVLAVVRAGRGRGLVRDLVCAVALAIVIGAVASWITSGASPDLVPELFGAPESPPFPNLRVATVLIVSLVLSPYVTVEVKSVLRWSSVAVVITPLLLGLASVTTLCGAIVLSTASVAAVRFVFGSPDGLPAISRLHATLDGVGMTVSHLAYRDYQPGTVGLATAVSPAGEPLHIKIYGLAAANRQRAERIWNAMWYHPSGPAPGSGRIEQAQHEALALMTARAAGVNVPEVKAAGRTVDGDVLLVTGSVVGTRLVDVDRPIESDDLTHMWTTLVALHHDARITHGRVDDTTIRIDERGVELSDLAHASLFPTEQQFATDIVSMLAAQALATDPDRAVDAAIANVSSEDLSLCLPYIQDAILAPKVRTALRRARLKTDDLRDLLAGRLGIDAPELAPIKRVETKDIVLVIFAIVAANTLIGQIANIGLDNLGDELAHASPGWFVVAFGLKLFSYVTAYFGLRALVAQPLPMFPTTLLQSAKGFVGLIVPSLAGRVGLDIRFLQNLGVPLAVATTQGPIISFIGFLSEVTLLVVCGASIGRQVDTEAFGSTSGGVLIAIAVGVIAVGAIIIAVVPGLRAKVLPALHDAVTSIKHIIASPRTVGSIYVSETAERLISALALAATVTAFDAEVAFPALVFVSVGTGLLAGIAPVPGGIGVAEATLGGLLTTVGLPPQQAVTIAITYRLLTSYLPPVLGFFSFRWLTKQGYL